MSSKTIRETVRQFVTSNFLLGRGSESLSDDDSFLDHGIIDSTGILELVSFVEQTFGVRCEDDELVPDNLDSVNRVTAFLVRKLPKSPSDETFEVIAEPEVAMQAAPGR
jgi:acyl carrier protein